MSRDWESIFQRWSHGPSNTEQQRVENAERQVKQAIKSSSKLADRDIKVFTQGSYRNRVNVRKDSDVDVGVLCYDSYFPEYPDDNVKVLLEKKSEDSTYTYAIFKNEIEEALVTRFGRASVKRGNKSLKIRENSYRVEADVAAFFEHRRYTSENRYLSGVEMIPDDHIPFGIKNWPEQHYRNGVEKNTKTSRIYKKTVRIIKTLAYKMADNGVQSATDIPGFLIECLVWNVPNPSFDRTNYYALVRSVLAYLFNETIKDESCSEWGEVSELKYLFRSSQPWTRLQAHNFIDDAWDYVGYK